MPFYQITDIISFKNEFLTLKILQSLLDILIINETLLEYRTNSLKINFIIIYTCRERNKIQSILYIEAMGKPELAQANHNS